MIQAIALLLAFQLGGETLRAALHLPVPGPVIGMAMLLVWLVIRGGPDQALRNVRRSVVGTSYSHLFRNGSSAYGGVYGGQERAQASGAVTAGDAVAAFVRPEVARLAREMNGLPADQPRFSAQVDSLLFDGANSAVLLHEQRTRLPVRIALPQTGEFADLRPGQAVCFGFDPQRAVCFRAPSGDASGGAADTEYHYVLECALESFPTQGRMAVIRLNPEPQ